MSINLDDPLNRSKDLEMSEYEYYCSVVCHIWYNLIHHNRAYEWSLGEIISSLPKDVSKSDVLKALKVLEKLHLIESKDGYYHLTARTSQFLRTRRLGSGEIEEGYVTWDFVYMIRSFLEKGVSTIGFIEAPDLVEFVQENPGGSCLHFLNYTGTCPRRWLDPKDAEQMTRKLIDQNILTAADDHPHPEGSEIMNRPLKVTDEVLALPERLEVTNTVVNAYYSHLSEEEL